MAQTASHARPGYYDDKKRPEWRLFQLAFLLLNLPSMSNQSPADPLNWPGQWRRDFLRLIWPKELPEPDLFYSPLTLQPGSSMHMKTVVVDRRQWLVTSANFTSRGQERNFEIGALVNDGEAAGRVLQWFTDLVECGVFVLLEG